MQPLVLLELPLGLPRRPVNALQHRPALVSEKVGPRDRLELDRLHGNVVVRRSVRASACMQAKPGRGGPVGTGECTSRGSIPVCSTCGPAQRSHQPSWFLLVCQTVMRSDLIRLRISILYGSFCSSILRATSSRVTSSSVNGSFIEMIRSISFLIRLRSFSTKGSTGSKS